MKIDKRSGRVFLNFTLGVAAVSGTIWGVGRGVMLADGYAHVRSAQAALSTVRTAIDRFRLDCGRYPTSKEGFGALVKQPEGAAGWNGPYLPHLPSDDPWGHPYLYKWPGFERSRCELKSYGADGKPGGTGPDADIGG